MGCFLQEMLLIIIINKTVDKSKQSGIINKENDSYYQLERSNHKWHWL